MNHALVSQSDLPFIQSALAAQEDVFVCSKLSPEQEAAVCVDAVRHGPGVVVSASGRRLRAVASRLQGRRLRIDHAGQQAKAEETDITLVALKHLGTAASGSYRWGLVLDDVITPAMYAYSLRAELRSLLSGVDATCVCVDVATLCQRLGGMMCLEPNARVLAPVADIVAAPSTSASPPESAASDALFEVLRGWRSDEARRRKVPAYRVLTNRTLRLVCEERPADLAALSVIPGIGQKTIDEHGASLLAALVAAQS